MKERIQKLIHSQGLTSSQFAEIIGVQRSSISHILSGRNNPSLEFVTKTLEKFTNVNTEWLVFGKGKMYKSKSMDRDLFLDYDTADTSTQKQANESKQKERTPEKKEKITEQLPPIQSNTVERIVIFYHDKTFETYRPRVAK